MAGLNLFTNNAATTLASGVLIGATSLTVATGDGAEFPTLAGSQYFYCTLANNSGSIEIIKVTARSTDTFTIVRAQDGTSAAAWSAGDKVELRLNRIDLLNFPQLDSTNTFATTQTFTAAPVFTDQSGTRTAMLAAKSGANSDITSFTGLTTPLSAAQGGTGVAGTLTGILYGNTTSAQTVATTAQVIGALGTLTANNVLLGNGTSALQVVAPGTTGNLLTSNGTTWQSTAAPGSLTLLGTITPTAVNSISLSSLVLTSYKQVQLVGSYSPGSAASVTISSDNNQTQLNITTTASNVGIYGITTIDLGTSVLACAVAGLKTGNVSALVAGGSCNITTASTTIYLRLSSSFLFNASGSISVYGVK